MKHYKYLKFYVIIALLSIAIIAETITQWVDY